MESIDSISRYGIKVAGFSADGDVRLLNSMLFNSKLNSSSSHNHTFIGINSTICFLQDIVHIATKLRNRLLHLLTVLVVGNKVASVSHLKLLINLVSKDQHGLVYSDICPDDRQNFDSIKRIMLPNVRAALGKYVIDSEGTVEYIRICHEITSSLYDDELSPLDRVYFIWRATFFLRAWYLHIKQSRDYKLNSNFITSNAHMCIELNAKNLVVLMKTFRNMGLEKQFVPTIFNSQPCEQTFRKFRSMGTINYTKITFTLLELIHLVGRIELMNDIMHFKLADVDVIFPRDPLKKINENSFDLPSDAEIENTISKALAVAVKDAEKFDIFISQDDIKTCPLNEASLHVNNDNENSSDDEFVDLGIANHDPNEILIEYENLKDYSTSNETPDENGSFVNVVSKRGIKTVRKSSLMWNLSGCKNKLSSDRLRRVRGSSNKKTPYRQLEFVDVSMINQPMCKATDIQIGDWCIFRNVFDANKNTLLLGNILSFKYVHGKTNKQKKYSWDFAKVSGNSREIETLASWYQINMENITFDYTKITYIHLQHYVATLSSDVIQKQPNGNISLNLC